MSESKAVANANQEEHDKQQGVILQQLVMTIMSEFMMTHECSFEPKKNLYFPLHWLVNMDP